MTTAHVRTAARTTVTAVAATLLVCALAGPARAATGDPAQDGLWYYTVPGIDQINASGITGAGITVAVIDGQINPDVPDLAGTDLIVEPDSFCDADGDGNPEPATATTEEAEHATRMVSLLIGTGVGVNGQLGTHGVAPGATVRHYAQDVADVTCALAGVNSTAIAVDQAVADGADIISMSLAYDAPIGQLMTSIARAERAGVLIVAASNNRGGTDLGWPASANGVIAVENADVNQQLGEHAVTNPLLTVVAPGIGILGITPDEGWTRYAIAKGSSYATAWTAGVLALGWSAHPQATANQMIQALVRTTAQASGGDPVRVDDSWGYGTVSARNLVAIDPTTLPDTNPLLRDTPDALPASTDITGTPEPTATPTSEPTPTADPAATPTTPPATTDAGVDPLLLTGGVLLLVLALAGVVTAIVVARRKPGPPQPGPPQAGPSQPGPPPPAPGDAWGRGTR